jgi:hypothetical protein
VNNVLALILLFSHNALVGSVILGRIDTVAHCHKANAAAIVQHAKDIPAGVQAFGLCIDTGPFAQRLKAAPRQFNPAGKNPADPLNAESFQQTASR